MLGQANVLDKTFLFAQWQSLFGLLIQIVFQLDEKIISTWLVFEAAWEDAVKKGKYICIGIIAYPLERVIMAIQNILKSFLEFPVAVSHIMRVISLRIRIDLGAFTDEIGLIVYYFLFHRLTIRKKLKIKPKINGLIPTNLDPELKISRREKIWQKIKHFGWY